MTAVKNHRSCSEPELFVFFKPQASTMLFQELALLAFLFCTPVALEMSTLI